eukprot:gene43865-54500_t
MGMTAFYGSFNRKAQEDENLKTIAKALEIDGMKFSGSEEVIRSQLAD